ncbi:Transcriptional regulator, AbiEi antitoxin, Type IV TA system [Nakamurella panacisegetis]|uniref:Transcriptional regulator, AbiEi antitoxin, Type IV TA system n=1 Tax=Nakamurella panacisegetis TaxID=1090615 RepID=A0A1H0IB19_9ACTN|nr:hypothetical protein [Nakamurella panacisegetis]SDO28566.1 Transcriptional regulator, AbiEi antitoxin, Type IV TA system [Nakamurella panacisegetis]
MTSPRPWTSRSSLLAGDLTDRDIRQAQRRGELHRFRPGRYADGDRWDRADGAARHRIRALEIGDWLGERAVISHTSAATVLGISLPRVEFGRVHATWPSAAGRGRTTNINPHRSRLRDVDIAVVDGVLTTSPARTVFDIARSLPWEYGIAAADSVLHLGMCTSDDLFDALEAAARTPGAGRAARIIEFADAGSESVGESICRLRFAQVGLPAPRLQAAIGLADGTHARVDFDFDGYATVGEFDGQVKYGRLLKPGQDPGDVVFAEKVREDRIRDTDRQCVRFIWRDFGHRASILSRTASAFARAGHKEWTREPPRFMEPGRLLRV